MVKYRDAGTWERGKVSVILLLFLSIVLSSLEIFFMSVPQHQSFPFDSTKLSNLNNIFPHLGACPGSSRSYRELSKEEHFQLQNMLREKQKTR